MNPCSGNTVVVPSPVTILNQRVATPSGLPSGNAGNAMSVMFFRMPSSPLGGTSPVTLTSIGPGFVGGTCDQRTSWPMNALTIFSNSDIVILHRGHPGGHGIDRMYFESGLANFRTGHFHFNFFISSFQPCQLFFRFDNRQDRSVQT